MLRCLIETLSRQMNTVQPSTATSDLRFDVESLERRELLAGNVNVVLTGGGDLRITGDNAGNAINITTDAVASTVTVTGGYGTTINNGSSPVTLSVPLGGALPDDLIVNMRGGDDMVSIGNATTPLLVTDQVVIKMGAGNDLLGIRGVAADDLNINSGSGDDITAVVASGFVTSTRVTGGSGNDAVYFDCGFYTGTTRISLGGGDDGVFLAGVFGDLDVIGGAGNDLVTLGANPQPTNSSDFRLGGGDDVLAMSDTARHPNMAIVGGGGNDTFVASTGAQIGYVRPTRSLEVESLGDPNGNVLTVASVLAVQAEWTARGGNPLVFFC